jgi:NADH dehydrogenase (ubiquinone) Fe-S protein 5
MVQGFGAFGGRGRCYSFWQDYMKCLTDNGRRLAASKCNFEKEDYMECLHGRKMVSFAFSL